MSGKSENIIELKHISKVYSDNGFKAVDDFNLEVKRGEFEKKPELIAGFVLRVGDIEEDFSIRVDMIKKGSGANGSVSDPDEIISMEVIADI